MRLYHSICGGFAARCAEKLGFSGSPNKLPAAMPPIGAAAEPRGLVNCYRKSIAFPHIDGQSPKRHSQDFFEFDLHLFAFLSNQDALEYLNAVHDTGSIEIVSSGFSESFQVRVAALLRCIKACPVIIVAVVRLRCADNLELIGAIFVNLLATATGKSANVIYTPLDQDNPTPYQLQVRVQLRRNNQDYGDTSLISQVTVNP